MKNKFLLLSIAVISAVSIFSCKEDEAPTTTTPTPNPNPNPTVPTIIGTWEMTKRNLKAYLSGVKFIDTTEMAQAGTSSLAIFKANKSILLIESEKSKSDTISGTYSIAGTTMVLNLIDPVDGPYTEEYESLTYDTTYMSFIGYDPNKTDPNRTVYTPTFKRK